MSEGKNFTGYSARAEHISMLTDFDIHLFKSGKHFKLYEKLGAHPLTVDGKSGTYFAVWAPSAEKVSVIGDFNNLNENFINRGLRL